MRQWYDDFDDFDFDESGAAKRMLREMQREKARMASRRKHGPGLKRRWDEFDTDSEDFGDYEDFQDYDDYDDDEFDSYSGLDTTR